MEKVANLIKNSYPVRVTRRNITNIKDYIISYHPSSQYIETFETVHTYCMFIGIARSGTTLIGALLDAHPNIICANQQHVLRYLQTGIFSRRQIYYLLLRNSKNAAAKGRKGGGGYSYSVPNQWQGRFDQLHVIGDKSMAGVDVRRLFSNPSLQQRLYQKTGVKVRMIHPIRNPYDTITTKSFRRKLSIRQMIDEYVSINKKTLMVIQQIENETAFDVERIPVYLEPFIESPKEHLKSLCGHLGVETRNDYLNDCASIVYNTHHKTRYNGQWSRDLIDMVKENIDQFPYLKDYSYEE